MSKKKLNERRPDQAMEDNAQRIAACRSDASNWEQREGTSSLWDALDVAFEKKRPLDMLQSLINFFSCLDVQTQTNDLLRLGEVGRQLPDGLKRGIISYILAKHMEDSHVEVRLTAIQAVGMLTSQTLTEALTLKLASDESTRARIASAEALGELTTSTLHAFKKALSDPSWKVRAAAIQTLGTLSEQLIIEPLQTALDDEDFSVRSAALHTLGNFKGCLSNEYLVSLAAEETNDWITRDAAVTALERAGAHAQAQPLREMLDHAFEGMAEDEPPVHPEEDGKAEPPEDQKGQRPLFLMIYQGMRNTNRPVHLSRWREKVAYISNHLRKYGEPTFSHVKGALALLLLLIFVIGGTISIASKCLRKYGAVFSRHKGIPALLLVLIFLIGGIVGSSILQSHASGGTTLQNKAHLEAMNQPGSVVSGQTFSIRITATNDGSTTWTEIGNYQLACHIENTQGVGCMGTNEITISHSVSHNGTYTFVIQLTAPPTTGTYVLQWTMSQYGIAFGSSLRIEVLVT